MVKEIPSLIRAHAADALAAENQKEYVEYFYQVKLDRRINATQKPSNHLFTAQSTHSYLFFKTSNKSSLQKLKPLQRACARLQNQREEWGGRE